MVAHNIHCTVVEIPQTTDLTQRRLSARDLLPWADPYIAGLIRRLQAEVKAERAVRRGQRSPGTHDRSLCAELARPIGDGQLDFDKPDYDGWSRQDETPSR